MWKNTPSVFRTRQSVSSTIRSGIKSRGYSLIELTFVVATLVGIFSLGYANYREFQRRQYLDSAIRQTIADLRLAQQMAVSGYKPPTPAGNDCETQELGGYIFDRGTTPAAYRIYAVCPDWSNRVLVKGSVSLPSGVSMLSIGTPGNRFLFLPLARGIDQNSNVTITLRYTDSGVADRSIVVTPEGEIHAQ